MSNQGNIKTSTLLVLLKRIVGYFNGNESFTEGLFLNYRLLNKLFYFFRYLIFSVFHNTCQKVYKKAILFELKFQKSISRCSILHKIRMSNFVMWPFEYKVKSWKICPFLGLFFSEIKMMTFWIFHESNISGMISYFS